MTKNLKVTLWIVAIVLFLGLGFMLYSVMQPNSAGNGMTVIIMLVLGLILGGVIAFLLSRNFKSEPPVVAENSHTVAESLRKVFKIVSAEGHFQEIYNYEETTKLLNFIPSKKKALVIVQAKVLVGYDFEKLKWQIDEEKRTVKLTHFPAPEILSTETDYKYYNIEEQFFNLFSKDDLAKIQQNSKQQVIEAAKKSHLPEVAAEQMRTLMTELLSSKSFLLENPSVITDAKLIENKV